jgi:hypothetical protein
MDKHKIDPRSAPMRPTNPPKTGIALKMEKIGSGSGSLHGRTRDGYIPGNNVGEQSTSGNTGEPNDVMLLRVLREIICATEHSHEKVFRRHLYKMTKRCQKRGICRPAAGTTYVCIQHRRSDQSRKNDSVRNLLK